MSWAPTPHHRHFHSPPSQKRLWPPSAPIDSNFLAHPSHTKRDEPSSSVVLVGGPVWPLRKRAEHGAHNVLAVRPRALAVALARLAVARTRSRHAPPSQKRRCPPMAPTVAKVRLQSGHTYWPSSFTSGLDAWPDLKRAPHALHSVFGPFGPLAFGRRRRLRRVTPLAPPVRLAEAVVTRQRRFRLEEPPAARARQRAALAAWAASPPGRRRRPPAASPPPPSLPAAAGTLRWRARRWRTPAAALAAIACEIAACRIIGIEHSPPGARRAGTPPAAPSSPSPVARRPPPRPPAAARRRWRRPAPSPSAAGGAAEERGAAAEERGARRLVEGEVGRRTRRRRRRDGRRRPRRRGRRHHRVGAPEPRQRTRAPVGSDGAGRRRRARAAWMGAAGRAAAGRGTAATGCQADRPWRGGCVTARGLAAERRHEFAAAAMAGACGWLAAAELGGGATRSRAARCLRWEHF